jgi:hypothetical protein
MRIEMHGMLPAMSSFGFLVAVTVVCCGSAACQRSDPPRPTIDAAEVVVVQTHDFPAGTPKYDACAVDADCFVAAVSPSDACCDHTTTAQPLSVKYVEFMQEHRQKECAGVGCPPLAMPGAMPAPCAMQARCDRGHCVGSCGMDAGPAMRPHH